MSISRTLRRCAVTLEAHSALSGERIDLATTRIEALFDELEDGARRFTTGSVQHGVFTSGGETCRVELSCRPELTSAELDDLTAKIFALLQELPDVTPRTLHAVARKAGGDEDTDPGEPPRQHPGEMDDRPTRAHGTDAVATRPEGAKARPRPPPVVEAHDEVTDPNREVPTRPEGVISIRRK